MITRSASVHAYAQLVTFTTNRAKIQVVSLALHYHMQMKSLCH